MTGPTFTDDQRKNLRYWAIALPVAVVVMFFIVVVAFVLADAWQGGPTSRSAIEHIDAGDAYVKARALRADCLTGVDQLFKSTVTDLIVDGLSHPGGTPPPKIQGEITQLQMEQTLVRFGFLCPAPDPADY